MDFSKDHVGKLLDNAALLLDEIEALKYSSRDVEFEKKEEGQTYSILELVCLIDHAQENYFRPLVESLLRRDRPRSSRMEHFVNTFVFERDPEKTLEEMLNKVIKHRAAFLNYLSKLPIIDWDRSIYLNGVRKTIFDMVKEMTDYDKKQLKVIADRVMASIRR